MWWTRVALLIFISCHYLPIIWVGQWLIPPLFCSWLHSHDFMLFSPFWTRLASEHEKLRMFASFLSSLSVPLLFPPVFYFLPNHFLFFPLALARTSPQPLFVFHCFRFNFHTSSGPPTNASFSNKDWSLHPSQTALYLLTFSLSWSFSFAILNADLQHLLSFSQLYHLLFPFTVTFRSLCCRPIQDSAVSRFVVHVLLYPLHLLAL